jgi:hypothetical protein
LQSTEKTRTQRVGESLQEFATVIEQLVYRAYLALPEDHKRREVGKAFAGGVGDHDIKIQFLLGGEKTVKDALKQALELQAVILAARLRESRARTSGGADPPQPDEETKDTQRVRALVARPLPG